MFLTRLKFLNSEIILHVLEAFLRLRAQRCHPNFELDHFLSYSAIFASETKWERIINTSKAFL